MEKVAKTVDSEELAHWRRLEEHYLLPIAYEIVIGT